MEFRSKRFPDLITKRAKEIVTELVNKDINKTDAAQAVNRVNEQQSIYAESVAETEPSVPEQSHPAEEYLKTLEIDKVTPLEALNVLDQLKRMI